jgi:hypothetical protein
LSKTKVAQLRGFRGRLERLLPDSKKISNKKIVALNKGFTDLDCQKFKMISD